MIETVDQSFKYRHYSTVVLVAVVAIAQLNHDPRVGSSPVLGPSIFFFRSFTLLQTLAKLDGILITNICKL